MTISIRKGFLALRCDNCSIEPSDIFMPSPADARAKTMARQQMASEAKNKGWIIRRTAGSWVHYCPDCAKRHAGDLSRQDRLI